VATLSGVILTNIFILMIWSIVDPFSAKFIVTNEVELEGYYTCSCNHAAPWLTLELLFFLFLLCFGIYVIYNTWSFQRQALLKETRWVLLALYNVVLNIFTVVPILAVTTINERAISLIVVFSIDLSATSIIAAVLLPRVIQKLEYSHSGSKGSSGKSADGSIRSPVSANVPEGLKKKAKKEFSRTPEEELAKKLEEPLPLYSPRRGGVDDRESEFKSEESSYQIELLPLDLKHQSSIDIPHSLTTELSTSHHEHSPPSSPHSPNGTARLEGKNEDLDSSTRLERIHENEDLDNSGRLERIYENEDLDNSLPARRHTPELVQRGSDQGNKLEEDSRKMGLLHPLVV